MKFFSSALRAIIILVTTQIALGKWTIIMYQVADNDLDCRALTNIQQLLDVADEVARENDVVILSDRADPSYWASCDTQTIGGVEWAGNTMELKVNVSGSLEVLQDHGELDMSDPLVLETFIGRTVTAYPADDYMLVLWDHGNAWHPFGLDLTVPDTTVEEAANATNATAANATAATAETHTPTVHGMGLPKLRKAVERGMAASNTTLSLLMFDASSMQTFAVLQQAAPLADYIIASEEILPVDRWDYRGFAEFGKVEGGELASGFYQGALSAKDLGEHLVDYFSSPYTGNSPDSPTEKCCVFTLSMVNTRKWVTFTEALFLRLRELSEELDKLDMRQVKPNGLMSSEASRVVAMITLWRHNSLEMFQDNAIPSLHRNLVDMGYQFLEMLLQGDRDLKLVYLDAVTLALNDMVMWRATGVSMYFPARPHELQPAFCNYRANEVLCDFMKAYYRAVVKTGDAVGLSSSPDSSPADSTLRVTGDEAYLDVYMDIAVVGYVTECVGRWGYYTPGGIRVFLGEGPCEYDDHQEQHTSVAKAHFDGFVFGLRDANSPDQHNALPVYRENNIEQYYRYKSQDYKTHMNNNIPVFYHPAGSSGQQPMSGFLMHYFHLDQEKFRLFVTTEAEGLAEVPAALGGHIQPYLIAAKEEAGSERRYAPYLHSAAMLQWGGNSSLERVIWHINRQDPFGYGMDRFVDLHQQLPDLLRTFNMELQAHDFSGNEVRLDGSFGGNGTLHDAAVGDIVTKNGCRCLREWQYQGVKYTDQCADPFGEQRGLWCFIVPSTCSYGHTDGHLLDWCYEAQTLPGEMSGDWRGEGSFGSGAQCEVMLTGHTYDKLTRVYSRCDEGQRDFFYGFQRQVLGYSCAGDGALYMHNYDVTHQVEYCSKVVREGERLEEAWVASSTAEVLARLQSLEAVETSCALVDRLLEVGAGDMLNRLAFQGQATLAHDQWNCKARAPPEDLLGEWSGTASFPELNDDGDAIEGSYRECAASVSLSPDSSHWAVVLGPACSRLEAGWASAFGTLADMTANVTLMSTDFQYCERAAARSYGKMDVIVQGPNVRHMCVNFQRQGPHLLLELPLPPALEFHPFLEGLHCPDPTRGMALLNLTLVGGAPQPPATWQCPAVEQPVTEETLGLPLVPFPREMQRSWRRTATEDGDECTILKNVTGAVSRGMMKCDQFTEGEWLGFRPEYSVGLACTGEGEGFVMGKFDGRLQGSECTHFKVEREGLSGPRLSLQFLVQGDMADCWELYKADEFHCVSGTGGGCVQIKQIETYDHVGPPLAAADYTCSRQPLPPELQGMWKGSEVWIEDGEQRSCALQMATAEGMDGLDWTFLGACYSIQYNINQQLIRWVSRVQLQGCEEGGAARGLLEGVTVDGRAMCVAFDRSGDTLTLAATRHFASGLPRYSCPSSWSPGLEDEQHFVISLVLADADLAVEPAAWGCRSSAAPAIDLQELGHEHVDRFYSVMEWGANADDDAAGRWSIDDDAGVGVVGAPTPQAGLDTDGLEEFNDFWYDDDADDGDGDGSLEENWVEMLFGSPPPETKPDGLQEFRPGGGNPAIAPVLSVVLSAFGVRLDVEDYATWLEEVQLRELNRYPVGVRELAAAVADDFWVPSDDVQVVRVEIGLAMEVSIETFNPSWSSAAEVELVKAFGAVMEVPEAFVVVLGVKDGEGKYIKDESSPSGRRLLDAAYRRRLLELEGDTEGAVGYSAGRGVVRVTLGLFGLHGSAARPNAALNDWAGRAEGMAGAGPALTAALRVPAFPLDRSGDVVVTTSAEDGTLMPPTHTSVFSFRIRPGPGEVSEDMASLVSLVEMQSLSALTAALPKLLLERKIMYESMQVTRLRRERVPWGSHPAHEYLGATPQNTGARGDKAAEPEGDQKVGTALVVVFFVLGVLAAAGGTAAYYIYRRRGRNLEFTSMEQAGTPGLEFSPSGGLGAQEEAAAQFALDPPSPGPASQVADEAGGAGSPPSSRQVLNFMVAAGAGAGPGPGAAPPCPPPPPAPAPAAPTLPPPP